jgi:hypothetical protein
MIKGAFHSAASKLLLIAAVLLFFSACKKQKEGANISGPATPNFITEHMEKAMLDYEWFSAKVSTEMNVKGENRSFKTNLRMRKDSIIWMSITPALGIEVARIIITPDSVKVLDKWNDQYFVGDHSFIEEKLNMSLEFAMLQDLAIGNPMLYDREEKFKGNKDNDGYVLTSKSKAKVRKAAGMRMSKKNMEGMEDTLIMDINERKYDRVMDRYEEDDEILILKRYWLKADDFKVLRTIITDLSNLRSVEADYGNFEKVQGQLIPHTMTYRVTDTEQEAFFSMEYSKVKLNEPSTFPFSIPEKFKPMN